VLRLIIAKFSDYAPNQRVEFQISDRFEYRSIARQSNAPASVTMTQMKLL
jgi:hypothetical protein